MPSSAGVLALRLDDVGASSKQFEVYSTRSVGWGPCRVSGNWLFLKYLDGWKSWGPYRELTATEWRQIVDVLRQQSARMTVAITAAWADRADRVIPFPERFPEQAAALKEAVHQGVIEIANHGLTHCVLEGNAFRPRWFSSNRAFHREFWSWVPASVQDNHLRRSQQILQEYFEVKVVTFVPPGNVYTDETLAIAERYGLRIVSCDAPSPRHRGLTIVGHEAVVPFHDRDLVLNGVDWMRALMSRRPGVRYCSVSDLAATGADSRGV